MRLNASRTSKRRVCGIGIRSFTSFVLLLLWKKGLKKKPAANSKKGLRKTAILTKMLRQCNSATANYIPGLIGQF